MTDIEWAMVHYDGNNDEPYADLVVDALRQKREVDTLARTYGINTKTMLELAKSKIKVTTDNINLQEEVERLREYVDYKTKLCDKFIEQVNDAYNGMSAIKNGMQIGIVSNSADAAKIFMDDTFNSPYKMKKSLSSLTYYYKNGDVVMWFSPSQTMRGHKFNKLFIQQGTDQNIINQILIPMVINRDIEYF